MDKSELIVELGVEEIPASMVESSARALAECLVQGLKELRLPAVIDAVWYTPRRIVVGLSDIPSCQEDLFETVMGPPKSVAYDAQGAPTRAAQAFAQKSGVPLSKVQIVHGAKGEYLSVVRKVRGEKTRSILQRLLPAAISKLQFPKTMYWSADKFRFARPIRWIVALYAGKVVRFRLADVQASNHTSGHRFLGKARIPVSSLANLQEGLRANGVLVDPAERETRIRTGLAQAAEAAGGRLLEDPDLLKTVVNLNEYPSVIRGFFEHRYLELPKEILVTVMREHQKYFSVMNDRDELVPIFLAVVNLASDSMAKIQAGHERVLRARLADAAFFWDTDRKKKLLEREKALEHVLFQEKMGSYHDKSRRMLQVLHRLGEVLKLQPLMPDLELAVRMCKTDLVTEMVKEFTDLQGVVGGLYARAEGYPENVWRAIYDQYLPKSTASPSPATLAGALLALVDRLDSVCGCFAVGLIPSGSRDPFALRRQGNGILKIILDHKLSVSLNQLIGWSLDAHGRVSEAVVEELKKFFETRVRFLLDEMGIAYDCVNSALASGFDDPVDTMERVRALQGMRGEADFLALASNFKRISNILAQSDLLLGDPEGSLMSDPSESALWQSFLRVSPLVESARAHRDYAAALRSLASLRPSVDEFFDKVLVMADDPNIRNNRLKLLNRLAQVFLSVADISQIVLERSPVQ